MLLPSMSLEELRKEFQGNKLIIEGRFDHRLPEMNRLSLNARNFPCMYHFNYKVNGNDYLVLMYFYRKKPFQGVGGNKYMVVGLMNSDKGKYAVRTTSNLTHEYGDIIERYQPHFFARYKSRCKKTQTGEALIIEYFKHNDLINPIYREVPNDDGSIHYAAFATCKDGILLGNYEKDTRNVKWNTFITRDMLSKIQARRQTALDDYVDLIRDFGFSEVDAATHNYYIR